MAAPLLPDTHTQEAATSSYGHSRHVTALYGGRWGPNGSACGLPRARELVLVASTTTRSLVQLKTAFRENVRNCFEQRPKNWGCILSRCKSAARGRSSEGGGAPLLRCFSRCSRRPAHTGPPPRVRSGAEPHTFIKPSLTCLLSRSVAVCPQQGWSGRGTRGSG